MDQNDFAFEQGVQLVDRSARSDPSRLCLSSVLTVSAPLPTKIRASRVSSR
jgi:hypothetical protein